MQNRCGRRGDRGTKQKDNELREPGLFRKATKLSSFLKRFHTKISDEMKRNSLLSLIS